MKCFHSQHMLELRHGGDPIPIRYPFITAILVALLALVLADEMLVKLGGDAIADTDAAWETLCRRLEPWWRPRK